MLNRSLVLKVALSALTLAAALGLGASAARADGDLQNVKHIIIVMQENRSFDNYFGVLPFVTGTPYHNAKGSGKKRACAPDDHTCVDGLTCSIPKKTGVLTCTNSNPSNTKGKVKSFHEIKYCTGPDLDHSWKGTHLEASFSKPGNTLKKSPMDGFVRLNALTQGSQAIDHDTMGYYDDTDLPFYYSLAETFAMNDRYFCSVLGQTFPNRSYFLTGTSFGHLTTDEIFAGPGVAYKPITGTIFDKLNASGISWVNYAVNLPYSTIFQPDGTHVHAVSTSATTFASDAAAGTLPAVSFLDASAFGSGETDEHPPADIRAGQQYVYQLVSALINSPSWKDSILVFTYDEHGGFYDHAWPPAAAAPDNIAPGQCADNSNPPTSTLPGGGVHCNVSATQEAPGQVSGAKTALCPTFTATGAYPSTCPGFNQLGIRVPFVMVSPFAKPHYVSHTIADHTSLLALIENRFLNSQRLTARDAAADDLEDMFDFDASPSLDATIPAAPPPPAADHSCPFGS